MRAVSTGQIELHKGGELKIEKAGSIFPAESIKENILLRNQKTERIEFRFAQTDALKIKHRNTSFAVDYITQRRRPQQMEVKEEVQ